jgi:hypothetical protein
VRLEHLLSGAIPQYKGLLKNKIQESFINLFINLFLHIEENPKQELGERLKATEGLRTISQ